MHAPAREDRSPRIALGVVDHEGATFVTVTLPRRPAAGIQDGGAGIEHPCKTLPGRLRERLPAGVGLHGGHQPELEDEAVVVGRQLAVQTVVEGVGGKLALQKRSRAVAATGRSGRTTGTRRRRRAVPPPRR